MKMRVSNVDCQTNGQTIKTKVRWFIAALLFLITIINYADRATISLAGPVVLKEYHISPLQMGYILSAFAWSYMLIQIPGGWILDRFGAKQVYGFGILFWSVFTAVQGFVPSSFDTASAVAAFVGLRLLMGAFEGPSFPANSRIVLAWFPTTERGTASAIFVTGQYFATVIFSPLLAWITQMHGWRYNFIFMGFLGVIVAIIFYKTISSPEENSHINQAELDYIKAGGGVSIDAKREKTTEGVNWSYLKQLLCNRMLWGINIGQLGLASVTYFFLTWFPIYLVQARGLSILKAGFAATLPALMGVIGGMIGGMFSDYLIKRGHSLTFARKLPVICGMLVSMTMFAANYIETTWLIVAIMGLSFFGKAFAALGWTIVTDVAPKEAQGICGGIFNTIANISGIVTPIIIGYIIQVTGSFNGALIFVAGMALVTITSYLVIVGEIKRIDLK